MKTLILGGTGIQDSAVAYDLVKKEDLSEVVIVAGGQEALDATASWIKREQLKTIRIDISDKDRLVEVIQDGGFDFVVSAIP